MLHNLNNRIVYVILQYIQRKPQKKSFLVDSPLRGGGRGGKGLSTEEKKYFFFKFVAVILATKSRGGG